MPRHVDHAARRHEILCVATSVVAESGMRGLSFRAIADRLGGSTTMVTHFYPTMKDLLDELATSIVDSWDEEIVALEHGVDDPYGRLMLHLEWLLPVDEEARIGERARINLLADELTGNDHRKTFKAWDRKVRGLLRTHLEPLVPEGRIDDIVELLRVVTNGVVLSVMEHPGDWPRRRQLAVVGTVLEGIGLPAPPPPPKPARRRRRATVKLA
jgi:AcrR family transcriptional regulator